MGSQAWNRGHVVLELVLLALGYPASLRVADRLNVASFPLLIQSGSTGGGIFFSIIEKNNWELFID